MQTFKTTPFGFRPWRLMLATLVLAVAGGVAQTAVAAPPEGLPPGMGPGPHGMHPGMRPGMQRAMHPGPEMAGGGVRSWAACSTWPRPRRSSAARSTRSCRPHARTALPARGQPQAA
jgi:hypothetical protein